MTVVAIDGPAGAGKSTVARLVAERLGFRYVDTGAMYRALALTALRNGVDLEDGRALAALMSGIGIATDGGEISVDGVDVSAAIRSAAVTAAVSTVASHPEVREALVGLQRASAAAEDCVMEGRDIGTTVFPEAEVKVYLTAASGERARRRWKQLGAPVSPSVAEIEDAITERDESDSGRATSPLMKAPDAHVIDTSGRDIDEVVESIAALVPTS